MGVAWLAWATSVAWALAAPWSPAGGESLHVDAAGCGQAVLRGRPVRGAERFCVDRWFLARLEEDAVHAVMLVRPRADPQRPGWPRLFVYRAAREPDGPLRPRFLSSGFPTLRVEGVSLLPGDPVDRLRLHVRGADEGSRALTCGFVGFPLACGVEEG